MTDNVLRPRRRTRPIAWVALGLGALISVFIFWSSSSASSTFYLAVFGPANDGAVFYFLSIYVLVAMFEIMTFFVVKGWRNRVIVIAGVVFLLIPIAVALWVVESPTT
jgi:hypothetical protein